MEYSTIKTQSGFAMLFTVLIISLILTIAVGISNLTLRQSILSNLAKDSGIAFYQADAGVECGMYLDTYAQFPYNATTSSVPSRFMCGDKPMVLDTLVPEENTSTTNYFRYIPEDETLRSSTSPCFSIVFDKTNIDSTGEGYALVKSSGYSSCGKSPRQVERLLQVRY